MAEENPLKDIVIPVISICSFFVSFLSILLSLTTFYLNQLKKAIITVFPSEHINLGYFGEGNFQLIISLMIMNSGIKTAVVNRFSLIIQESDINHGYLLETYSFQKINDNGHFQADSLFSPIALQGGQSLTKLILFRSSLENLVEFRKLQAGKYNLTLLGWTDNSFNPNIKASFEINISSENINQLNNDLYNKTGNTIRISQVNSDKYQAKSLSENQIRTLLKK